MSLPPRPQARPAAPARRALGQILLERGVVQPGDLVRALAMQARESAGLADILLANGMVTRADLMAALATQWGAEIIDPDRERPDPRLIDRLGAARCLRSSLLPWRLAGGTTVIATSHPDDFEQTRPILTELFGPVVMALIAEPDLWRAVLAARRSMLNLAAETTLNVAESCRGWNAPRLARRGMTGAAMLGGAALFWPAALFALLFGWAVLTLVLTTAVKLAATVAHLMARRSARGAQPPSGPATIARLPVVSILVPLFRETDIAARLVQRLGRLTYPRELLDVLLVVEEEDAPTRAALGAARLPDWMRLIVVPAGPLKTKPRAMNFALNFCRGTIIGIYDAEDAPEPDQLHRVVRRFHERGPEVGCLQGVLDFYNSGTNWLSRCFTVEYATWFRVVLPGMQRLGLPIPLGGTTLFFRRAVLEQLGGWDAHNVTEDADLGIRLARHGFRAELVETVTEEEACCHAGPWVRQRSRWLKGYAMTYAVHMRDPVLLWRQLGAWRFFGVQVLFLGTLSQFLLAPLLWTFWLFGFGGFHPLAAVLPPTAIFGLGLLFLLSEAINVIVGLIAVSGARHRRLRLWVPTLQLYFPLGALAAYKGLYELATCPFYWDKTQHGREDSATAPA